MELSGTIKLGEERPYSHDENCVVELWDVSRANFSEETRKEVITKIASLSYGNEKAKDPDKLMKVLVERGHESVFEFVRDGLVGNSIETSLRNLDFPTIKEYSTKEQWDTIFNLNRKNFALFRIKAPIFTLRQIMRTRQASYLELSRRYTKNSKVPFEFWYPDGDKTVKVKTPLGEITLEQYYELVENVYNSLLEQGYRPEVARSVIPVSLYSCVWIMFDDFGALNFFIYRLEEDAQKETRLIAEAMLRLLVKHQEGFVKNLEFLIPLWKIGGNPAFRKARKKRAEKFKKKIELFMNGKTV